MRISLALIFISQVVFAQELPAGHPSVDPSNSSKNVGSITPVPAEVALGEFKNFAMGLEVDSLRVLPTQHSGRIKPLDTLARESILFVSGSYSVFGLDALQTFLALTLSPVAQFLEIVEVRDPELRTELGFLKSKRRLSIYDLEKTNLMDLAKPLAEKEQQNRRSLTPREKKILETAQQVWLGHSIIDGGAFLSAIEFGALSFKAENSEVIMAGQDFLRKLSNGEQSSEQVQDLIAKIKNQELPEMLKNQLGNLDREVFYNRHGIFFWTAIILALIGCLFFIQRGQKVLQKKISLVILGLPVVMIALGLGLRVSITGFAPVTNMYGTMIWVAFGVSSFSMLLFILYSNHILNGILAVAAALILFLTESIPLILSPDLDPIVAVLRSNYWLTIHVLTITISYAAFSIAMVIGNIALVRKIFIGDHRNADFYRTYSHYAYRMIQLGVFLLTAGIILGGIWADYSWGRFWGWDPKETWALIADVGFLVILHARHTGWLGHFGVLASSPIAYLLVIMAWYGVNFILAAGLHSYGFSSGGALAVGIFVSLQTVILLVALGRYFEIFSNPTRQKPTPQ